MRKIYNAFALLSYVGSCSNREKHDNLMTMKSVFRNPQAVEKALRLPATISFRFIGTASADYEQKQVEIITRIVGAANIRSQYQTPSKAGRYISYGFDVYVEHMSAVESIYREIGALPETKFVI